MSWIDKSHDISNLIHKIINLIQSSKLVVKIIIVKLVVKRLYDTYNVIHNIIDLVNIIIVKLVVKRLYDTSNVIHNIIDDISNVIHNIIDLIQLSLFQSNL